MGEVIQHRPTQLVQRCKRHLQLGLDAGNLSDSTARRLPGAIVHQSGLAYSGLSAHDQDCTLALTNAIQHRVERCPLAAPAPEGRGTPYGHSQEQYTS
jgi:hypothetical protein